MGKKNAIINYTRDTTGEKKAKAKPFPMASDIMNRGKKEDKRYNTDFTLMQFHSNYSKNRVQIRVFWEAENQSFLFALFLMGKNYFDKIGIQRHLWNQLASSATVPLYLSVTVSV